MLTFASPPEGAVQICRIYEAFRRKSRANAVTEWSHVKKGFLSHTKDMKDVDIDHLTADQEIYVLQASNMEPL